MQTWFFRREMEIMAHDQDKHNRFKIIAGGIIAVLVVATVCFFIQPQSQASTNPAEIPSVIDETPTSDPVDYAAQKALNQDYLGHLYFESGLVDELTVQGSDNEYYLNYTVNKEYDSRGAVYLDYRNTLDDQNLIFYGHYVYADESLVFSPLHQLKEESNYENNKKIRLQLENECREYEIAYVYYYEMGNENLEYFHPNYEPEQFENYIANVKEKQFYNTGLDLAEGERMLTLQTCVRDRDDLRLIVVAKETNVVKVESKTNSQG